MEERVRLGIWSESVWRVEDGRGGRGLLLGQVDGVMGGVDDEDDASRRGSGSAGVCW